MREFLKSRTTAEIMMLMLTTVVAFTVLAGGATLSYMEFHHPEIDTTKTQEYLFTIVSTILGALLGLLTGSALSGRRKDEEPHDP
jgi:hypothetical protein